MDKFNNKYRIPSARLQSWDYGANGAYFITICTKHRQHFFGEIVETPKLGVSTQGVSNQGVSNIDADNIETPKLGVSTMQLNELGQLAETYWMEIPKHYPFIELGNFVVMPNHTHGILIIDKPDGWVETPKLGVSTIAVANMDDADFDTDFDADFDANIDANIDAVVETPKLGVSTGGKNEKWKPNTIGSIINQYKRMVTINCRKIRADFGWQSRFYDHIIRNAQSFETIQNYIANNPMNWGKDKFNDNNG